MKSPKFGHQNILNMANLLLIQNYKFNHQKSAFKNALLRIFKKLQEMLRNL